MAVAALFVSFFSVSFTLAGAEGDGSPQKKEAVATAKAKKRDYVSKNGGYRIACPEGWERHGGDVRPMDAIFFCLAEPGVNMSVTWAASGGQKELTKAAADEIKETFRRSYPGYSVTAEEWREMDGVKAYALSARHKGMGAELQNKQVMFIKGDRFYTITYTSTPALFMKHLGEFELAVESFRTTGGKNPPMVQSPQSGKK
jgi:hypothetical protein